jgi:hypothetical protein
LKKNITLIITLLAFLTVEVIAATNNQTYLPIVFYRVPPAPSPTLTPSPTPTPTTTPIPEEVIILPVSYVYESSGVMHVVGEVLNNTRFSLYFVEVIVWFYDVFGQEVGSGTTVMEPFNLPAWERGCFIIKMDIPLHWSTYVFDDLIYEFSIPSPGLNILASNWNYSPAFGDYSIDGLVRNDSDQISKSVKVGGTLYNSADVPVGCEYSEVAGYDLSPGQISEFHMNFSGDDRDYMDVDDYRLRITGDLP